MAKLRGGSGAQQAQAIHRTLTWTNPLKFLQNVRFKAFLPSGFDDKKPPHHAPLHEKVAHQLNKLEKKKGKRSLSHLFAD